MSGRPLDVLEAALEDVVTVTLKDGTAYYGTLAGYDQHMNAVLEPSADAEDAVGDLDATAVEDTTIIRGDNVVTIQT
ncbi:LSM domain-containing protein [Halobellus captivus]|uniref:LSM domain-containing protein n=1 Tax=Halobellus captivus TaxID=2592614 RepID=UPI0011AB2297|nr:LSM domain-containing protein [Halobellus captivus]